MECGMLMSQAKAYISEYDTIQQNFQKYVATHSYDDKAKHYEKDKDRVVGKLQGIYDEMKSKNCPGFRDITGWPAGVRR